MKEKEETTETQAVVKECSLPKPTMAPPGGSKTGYWECNKSTGEWVWNDTVA